MKVISLAVFLFLEALHPQSKRITGAPMCNLDPSLTDTPVGGKASKEISLGKHKMSMEFRIKLEPARSKS